MNVLIFGATGMVGQGALRACLRDPRIAQVQTVGRTATDIEDPKLRELVHADLWHYDSVEERLAGFDACLFCLGVSSGNVSAAQYERLTYELTLAAGRTLARLNPASSFVYISGAGTDSTERGASRWARVKGRTENALLALPFQAVMFRPGVIVPVHGEVSKTRAYRLFYTVFKPLMPLLRRLLPGAVTTTEELARAMIAAARGLRPPSGSPIVEGRDIGPLAALDKPDPDPADARSK